MAFSNIFFSDLQIGRCSYGVQARLLRFRQSGRIRRGGEIQFIDLLFVDGNGTLMPAKINADRLPSFRPMLTAGLMYSLSEFDVARCAEKFMLTDSSLVIRFNETTCLNALTNPIQTLPAEAFRFCDAAGLLRLADTNRRLPDIVAEISGVRSTVREPLKGKNHVMATVKIDNGQTIVLSLFDSEAISFHRRLESMSVGPRVVVATNVNPRTVGDSHLFVNATPWTQIYFDGITSAGQDRLTRLIARENGLPTTVPLLREIPAVNQMTIAQANSYAVLHPSEEIVVLCMARVTRINSEKGWSYVACCKCSSELRRTYCGLTCVRCENTNAAGVLRYRVELSIADNTAEGVVMCFDGVMTKLHRIEAREAGQGNNGVNADYSPMPLFISEMKGKIYAFHVRLPAGDFSATRRPLTITHIVGEHERLPSLSPCANGKGTSSATSMPASHSLFPQPGFGASSVDMGFISDPALIGDVLINSADPDAEVGKDKRMSLD